jgi:hypothetical protein
MMELQRARFVGIRGRTTIKSPADGKSILSSPFYAYLPDLESDVEWDGMLEV